MRLSELGTGEKGVIVKVLGHGGFRKRIVEMGFIKGKTVEVLLNAPLKDPIKYKVLGYEISLRRQEAEMIEVVSEEEAKKQAEKAVYHEGLPEDVSVKEEDMKRLALGKRRTINVALVGNPNSGKTSLFNLASGAHEHVGNYSGVTVDAKEGYFDFEGYHFRIVDLPGTYSLSAYTPEEIYVRRHIVDETPDVIINVVDSSNLERNLYLTTQLIDMDMTEYTPFPFMFAHVILQMFFLMVLPVFQRIMPFGQVFQNFRIHISLLVKEIDPFIKVDYYMKQGIQSTILLADSRHHRHPEQFTQQMIIQCITAGFQLIVNIQSHYHADIHVN